MLVCKDLALHQGAFRLTADWTVAAGRRVGVIGPSGAGKSTLIHALAGFVTPSAGQILMDGRDITQAHPAARGMAVLFQDGNLLPALTLFQNAGLGLRADLRLSAQERGRVMQALDKVGLAGLETRRPGEVSGGQMGRAALARVLLQGRPWLLLDEAFAALGPALRAEMLDLVADVLGETGAGLFMVTHEPRDAERLCDEVIFVHDGVADAPRPTGAFFAEPTEALRAYLG